MSESQDNQPKNAISLLGNTSAQITYDNMTLLCNQSEYEVAGETYKRRILKPKELVALYKLQAALDKISDQEKICLEGVTPQKWENTDAVKMEIVLGACLLISKGFRKI